MVEQSLQQRCSSIALLLLDVDGVLTDGSIIYAENGTEIKAFHVRDGSGLKLWERAGKKSGIITGRTSALVARRAAELGMAVIVQGAADKLREFRRILAEDKLRPEEVCFVGDDLPDVPVLRKCGLAVAVADACAEVRELAHYVSRCPGGRGAVREVIELILRVQGLWQPTVDQLLWQQEINRVDTQTSSDSVRRLCLLLDAVWFYCHFLGYIDGLPELPPNYTREQSGNEAPPPLIISSGHDVKIFQDAFGDGCMS